MPASGGTIENVAIELSKLLRPLERDLAPARAKLFFHQMGIRLTDAQVTAISGPLGITANRTTALIPRIGHMIDALVAEDYGELTSLSFQVIRDIADIIRSLDAVGSNIAGATTLSADEVAKRIFDYLTFQYLEAARGLNDVLEIIGLLDRDDQNQDSIDPGDPPFTIATYRFDRIPGWFSDPAAQIRTLYDWGRDDFDGQKLFAAIAGIAVRNGLPVIYDDTGTTPRLDLVLVEAVPKADVSPHGLLIRLKGNISTGVLTIPMGDDARLEIKADFQPPLNTGLVILPDGTISLQPPAPGPSFGGDFLLKLIARKTSPPEPFLLFGKAGESRLEFLEFILTTGARLAWSGSSASGAFLIGAEINHLKVIIDTTKGDGFLSKILPGTKVEADFGIQIGYSTDHGLYFSGSSALEVRLPLHIELGPVALEALTIAARLDAGNIPVSVGVDIRAALGPVVAVVQNMGITATISFPPNNSGNLGPLQFDLGFKPPNGVGLSIDTGVIRGGGYLFIDPDRGEYAGALELVFSGYINLKAIGIITTKMPDGSKGFSLLIIISVEFGTGIQLGYGFTLIAVGGLLGLNRTMALQPLMEGVRTGAINGVMFPHDIIANAPRIISDLRTLFPPHQGTFLIGPMAKLGWASLITVELGIIIEIPGNIALIGVLRVALPTADAPLLNLQVNFAGAIEFDKKRLYFFAALFESRIVFLTIEGEMGLLVAFGDDANFVLSVGGFHPQFSPPPLPFPSVRRISVSLINTSFARIRADGYFAITSNTVQFGAHAELFIGLSIVNVQGHLGFDALFQFSPFHFVITISASFSLNVFGIGLFSVRIRGTLEGTSPWRVRGEGSISFLFWDISADFDITWGESRDTSLPPISVMPMFKAEFEKVENWRALPPAGSDLLVTLRKLPETESALVLHPVGVLRVSQRLLPLELSLDKVGNQKPDDVKRLSVAVGAGGLARKNDAYEQFALAQFQDMSDSEKVSHRPFEAERAGLDLSAAGADLRSSRMVKRVVRYEEIILDSNFKRFVVSFFNYTSVLFNFFLGGNSISKSELSRARRKQFQPFEERVEVAPESYTVAFQATNQPYTMTSASFRSEASAREFLSTEIGRDANLAETLHVIPSYERAA